MALEIKYVGHRNSWPVLTEDSFTQANPPSPNATVANTSSTLDNQVNSTGVLGGSVAFTRPDVGSNYIGGPGYIGGAAVAEAGAVLPLGLFINDAVGNAYENTPGIASGKGPFVMSMGLYRVDLYETAAINAGTLSDGTAILADGAITYTAGLKLYASENGYLTAVPEDSYEVVHGGFAITTHTLMGVVIQAPTATSATMVVALRV
jgi:hypothetical protein